MRLLPSIPDSLRPKNLFKLNKDGGKKYDTAPSPMQRFLADGASATSEPSATELGRTPLYLPGDYDKRLASLVRQRLQDGLAHRRPHEGGWIESLAHYNGQAWHYWDASTSKLVHYKTLTPTQYHRSYVSHPIIKSRARKLVARALSNYIDFSFFPHSDLEQDRLATEEMRAAFEHIQAVNDWPALTFDVSRTATIFCPQYVMIHIDPSCEIDLPLWDVDEQGIVLREIVQGKGPEIKLTRLGSFDIVGDPRHKDPKYWRWFAREVYMTNAEIWERWPLMAEFICGNNSAMQNTSGASGQAMIRGVNRDIPYNSTPSGSEGAWMIEYWEIPSPMYPPGRDPITGEEHGGGRIAYVSDGGVVAEQGHFPRGLKRLPIVQFCYEKGIDTVHGQNALQPAVSAQQHYDETLSAVLDRSREHGKVLYATGAGIKHDAFQSGLGYEAIAVNVEDHGNNIGNVVQYIAPPSVDPSVTQMLMQSNADIGEIMEVNDISRGIAPNGVTSAAQFNAMTASDQSASTLFRENLKNGYQEVGEIIASLAPSVYGDQSRILSLSDAAPSQEEDMPEIEMIRQLTQVLQGAGVPGGDIARFLLPEGTEMMEGEEDEETPEDEVLEGKVGRARSRAYIFAHLTAGRVTVKADVKLVKSPQQRVADLMQMAQNGFFNPDNIETSLALLEQMGFEESDRVTRRLTTALKRILAEKQRTAPDPAALTQAQAEAEIKTTNARVAAETASKLAVLQQTHENAMEELMASGKAVLTPEQTALLMESVNVPAPTAAFENFESELGMGGAPQDTDDAGDPTAMGQSPMAQMAPMMPEMAGLDPSMLGTDAPPDASSGGLQIPGGEE